MTYVSSRLTGTATSEAIKSGNFGNVSPTFNVYTQNLTAGSSLIRNTNYYEMGLVHPKAQASHNIPLYKDDYRDTLDAIDKNGHIPVPQGVGLGVEIDWDWVKKRRTGVVEYK